MEMERLEWEHMTRIFFLAWVGESGDNWLFVFLHTIDAFRSFWIYGNADMDV